MGMVDSNMEYTMWLRRAYERACTEVDALERVCDAFEERCAQLALANEALEARCAELEARCAELEAAAPAPASGWFS